eukprot:358800-Prorocentrum_minimum.AAC.2
MLGSAAALRLGGCTLSMSTLRVSTLAMAATPAWRHLRAFAPKCRGRALGKRTTASHLPHRPIERRRQSDGRRPRICNSDVCIQCTSVRVYECMSRLLAEGVFGRCRGGAEGVKRGCLIGEEGVLRGCLGGAKGVFDR